MAVYPRANWARCTTSGEVATSTASTAPPDRPSSSRPKP